MKINRRRTSKLDRVIIAFTTAVGMIGTFREKLPLERRAYYLGQADIALSILDIIDTTCCKRLESQLAAGYRKALCEYANDVIFTQTRSALWPSA